MNQTESPPFTCTFTPGLAVILNQLSCSIAITTYQAGKLIFLSADENGGIRQLPRDFKRAMGLAVAGNRLAIATEEEVVVLSNAPGLAIAYPNKPAFYDQFYVPRASYYTGAIDLHDIAWDELGRLWGVNTLFSCLSILDDHFSFVSQWTPPFINKLASEDYCHLNGMAMVDGAPRFVTMFGKSDTAKGWREGIESGGLIMDVVTNAIIAKELPMPHSPRWINNELYCLLSATGDLVKMNTNNGSYDVVSHHNGFVRGLAAYGDYLFVGLSKNREKTSVERNLPVAEKLMECGLDVVHRSTGAIAGSLRYLNSTDEVYDVQVLPFAKRPGILNHTTSIHRKALHTPAGDFWAEE